MFLLQIDRTFNGAFRRNKDSTYISYVLSANPLHNNADNKMSNTRVLDVCISYIQFDRQMKRKKQIRQMSFLNVIKT